jgi:hypothetical protein
MLKKPPKPVRRRRTVAAAEGVAHVATRRPKGTTKDPAESTDHHQMVDYLCTLGWTRKRAEEAAKRWYEGSDRRSATDKNSTAGQLTVA